MSFRGMIEDVAVADVMQLIRLGGHSGTLTVNNRSEEGFIGFERGRIVSAWNPRTRRVGELLVAASVIDEDTLLRALETQNAERPRRAIGQILVRMGSTSPEAIRDVMATEIERVVWLRHLTSYRRSPWFRRSCCHLCQRCHPSHARPPSLSSRRKPCFRPRWWSRPN